jgi:hypothetical protein
MTVVNTKVKITQPRRKATFKRVIDENRVMVGRLRKEALIIEAGWVSAFGFDEIDGAIDILLAAKAELATQALQRNIKEEA